MFVSTEPIGNRGYMTWDQIKEIEKASFAVIGHHSHTHEYLIEKSNHDFIQDIETANLIFTNKVLNAEEALIWQLINCICKED